MNFCFLFHVENISRCFVIGDSSFGWSHRHREGRSFSGWHPYSYCIYCLFLFLYCVSSFITMFWLVWNHKSVHEYINGNKQTNKHPITPTPQQTYLAFPDQWSGPVPGLQQTFWYTLQLSGSSASRCRLPDWVLYPTVAYEPRGWAHRLPIYGQETQINNKRMNKFESKNLHYISNRYA